MTARPKTSRCSSCRWWERSCNFRTIDRDWGLCHFWGGKAGHRTSLGFIDYSFGHEPRGSDTCDWHNAKPEQKAEAQISGNMPSIKHEGEQP